MNRTDFKEFKNQNVTIAIPHIVLDRPFFITGILLEVNQFDIKIKTKGGYRHIQIDDVIEIRREP